ncbi:hypothetical protein LR948_12160 [Roseivivax sp. GX 12232]|uniref:hypothetical protein n=1 Tax=Roseivivax sp. GX 12232 TaxID=2900547 RepID=UPI001E48F2D0|nr:hypothetical protein [Roseivivax sp. GX 12232]MCE0506115.1 hypothetical protein [Roseivivax sp. GX 12232]
MLIPAPDIPLNLEKKLTTEVSRFLRTYDDMTLAEARRLLKGHDFRMPVHCSLSFHKNGSLKKVHIAENTKSKEPWPFQFGTTIRFLSSSWHGTRELWVPFLRWCASLEAKRLEPLGLLRPDRISDEVLAELIRKLPNFRQHLHFSVEDASALMLHLMATRELKLRQTGSAHQRLERATRPVPAKVLQHLEDERAAAFDWFEREKAEGYPPHLSFQLDGLSEEDRCILRYREVCYEKNST